VLKVVCTLVHKQKRNNYIDKEKIYKAIQKHRTLKIEGKTYKTIQNTAELE
jgi:hypothetical protein